MDGYAAAIGGHGNAAGKPRIEANGRSWVFTFDVPQFLANMERLAEEAARARVKAEIELVPDRDTPGGWGERTADRLFAAHSARIHGGACKPGGEFFTALYGNPKENRPPTPDGSLMIILASLRVEHPDATMGDVRALVIAQPVEVRLVLDQMGKALAAQAAAAKRSEPASR